MGLILGGVCARSQSLQTRPNLEILVSVNCPGSEELKTGIFVVEKRRIVVLFGVGSWW